MADPEQTENTSLAAGGEAGEVAAVETAAESPAEAKALDLAEAELVAETPPPELESTASLVPMAEPMPPTGALAQTVRRMRPRNWLRRTLEIAKHQSNLDAKLRWIDEMYRQMGERLDENGMPTQAELDAWLEIIHKTRREADLLQQRIYELENPEVAEAPSAETRPRMIAGGAAAKQPAEGVVAPTGSKPKTTSPGTSAATTPAAAAAAPEPSQPAPAAPTFQSLNPIPSDPDGVAAAETETDPEAVLDQPKPVRAFCGYCGKPVKPDDATCPHCGEELPPK